MISEKFGITNTLTFKNRLLWKIAKKTEMAMIPPRKK